METANFIALRGGERAGVIRVATNKNYLYICDLQVTPKTQGVGIGTNLINHATSLALSKNLESIRLCIFKGHSAKKFYEKLGFGIAGELGNFLRMDRKLQVEFSA